MRVFSLDGTVAEYDEILKKVREGATQSAALDAVQLSRTQFTRKRCIAEAAKLDLPRMQHALQQLQKVTLENIYPFAKDICNRNIAALRTLYTQGCVLMPKNHY